MKAKNFNILVNLVKRGMKLGLHAEIRAILDKYKVRFVRELPNYKAPFLANQIVTLINNKNKSQNGI